MDNMNLYGTILVQYSKELREELKDAGTNKCRISLEEIKAFPEVEDIWFTKSPDADIVIRIKVQNPNIAEKLKEKINSLDDIENVRLRLAIEAK